MEDNKPAINVSREPLLKLVVRTTTGISEKAVVHTFDFVRDAHEETHKRVGGAIGFVDETQQGVMRLLRTANDRIASVSRDAIGAIEEVLLRSLRIGRETADQVVHTTGEVTGAVIGTRAA